MRTRNRGPLSLSTLVDKQILCNWAGIGWWWCKGFISHVNTDGRRVINKAKVTFYVNYDMGDINTAHAFSLQDYGSEGGEVVWVRGCCLSQLNRSS